MATVAREPDARWAATRPPTKAPSTSGASPISTTTSPSKPISGSRPARTASPVPRRSVWMARSQPGGKDLGDGLLLGSRDHDQALRRQAEGGVDDVREHGPAADLVQDLRHVRLHPRAQAGGEDDDGQRLASLGHLVGHVSTRVVSGGRAAGCGGWGGRIRTSGCRDQNPVPYHLATPHRGAAGARRPEAASRAAGDCTTSPRRGRVARRGGAPATCRRRPSPPQALTRRRSAR